MHATATDCLEPIVSRCRTDTYWVVHDKAPSRVSKKLTAGVLRSHLSKDMIIGVVPMQAGSDTTRIALLDLDSHKGEVDWPEMQNVCKRVMEAFSAIGLKGIPFRSSGGMGIHVYFIWDYEQDAYSVRKLFKETLITVGYEAGTAGVAKGQIEVFPKQDSVSREAFGNMFVLPYARQSCALDRASLADIPRDRATWIVSDIVPIRQRTALEHRLPQPMIDVDLETVRAALKFIANNDEEPLEYDDWRNVIFGIHHATGGSAEGHAMAHEFSARCSKYNAEELDNRIWPYIGVQSGDIPQITVLTLFHLASKSGWVAPVDDDFSDIVPVSAKQKSEYVMPPLQRNDAGVALATVNNVLTALREPMMCGMTLRYDRFRDQIIVSDGPDIRPLRDTDYTIIRARLEREPVLFRPIEKSLIRDCVHVVAQDNGFDSAQDWLNGLVWDQVPRVAGFCADYLGSELSDYSIAISKYIWTALAGRALVPGIQADMSPIFISQQQGKGKTSTVIAMSPCTDYFGEVSFDLSEGDKCRALRSKLVVELGELKGMSGARIEAVRSFITRRVDKWTPKYQECETSYARRCLIIGTTNDATPLVDEDGNRRWLPIETPQADIERIKRDRDQLWAEGAVMFRQSGVLWQDAQLTGEKESKSYKKIDEWQSTVAAYITHYAESAELLGLERGISVNDVLSNALNFPVEKMHPGNSKRVVAILKHLGYQLDRSAIKRLWVKKE